MTAPLSTRYGGNDMDLDPDAVDRWIARVNADAEFRVVGRWSHFRFDTLRNEERRCFRVRASMLNRIDSEVSDVDTIVLKGSAEAWDAFLQPVPARHCHTILAMDRRRDDFAIESGRHHMIQNLRAIELIFELVRATLYDLEEARQ